MYSIYPCTLLNPFYLLEVISITSFLSTSILDSHNSSLLIDTSDHSTEIPLFTPSITLGLPSYHEVIRLTPNWMKSQYNIRLSFWIIEYFVNRNYILTASKTRQIQVKSLLNQLYEFKWPTTINNINYDDLLICRG